MRCARPIRDSRIAGVVIGSGTEVSIFSKILRVRFVWTTGKVKFGKEGSYLTPKAFARRGGQAGQAI